MEKKDISPILFTERFQQVYQYLGMFCYLYFLQGSQGISREELLQKIPSCQADTEDILVFLKEQKLFTEKQKRLYLNTSLFFTLSVWDLLVRVEPWIRQPPVETEREIYACVQEYHTIRMFAQTCTLSDSYINNL